VVRSERCLGMGVITAQCCSQSSAVYLALAQGWA